MGQASPIGLYSIRSRRLELRGLRVTDASFAGVPRTEHAHEWPFLAVILGGAIEKRFSRLSFGVPTASAFTLPAGVRHVDTMPNEGVRTLVIELDPSSARWEPFARLMAGVHRIRDPELPTLAGRTAIELTGQDDLVPLAVEGLVLEALSAAARRFATNGRTPRPPRWLNDVDEYIGANFRGSLSMADVAGVARVHAAHLARVFRRHHGETVGQRVRRLRLDWASVQLAESDLSLLEIALGAGFFDQSHFSRSFSRHSGMPPARYRADRQR